MSSILPYTKITLLIPTQLYFNYAFYLKTSPYKHIMSPESDHKKNPVGTGQLLFNAETTLLYSGDNGLNAYNICKDKESSYTNTWVNIRPTPPQIQNELKTVEISAFLNVLRGMWCNQFHPPDLAGEAECAGTLLWQPEAVPWQHSWEDTPDSTVKCINQEQPRAHNRQDGDHTDTAF